ncbi:hypothetical protein [Erythrobacter alti]|uniref:hypothetical protein n=1 Tax=Erythrobacter alti TaxID=1896145 RepID=UPI0030F3D3CA
MAIKLDMGKAWNEAVALLSANKDVVLIIAGVFFFLPNAIGNVALPPPAELEALAASGGEPDIEAIGAIFREYINNVWWAILLLSLIQAIGMLGLLALLTDQSRPTVGQALGFGTKALIPYFLTQILSAVLIMAVAGLLIGLGALINPALAALMALIALVLVVYLMVKFSLSSAVIAIEKAFNPLRVLQRSWKLTKGNSLRLFGFYLLLLIVFIVISMVAGMVFAIFAIMGEQIGFFATAIGGGLLSMALSAVMVAVFAALHRQLSGASSPAEIGTFD